MKKIYNQPACMVVGLGTMQMMAQSLIIDKSGTNSIQHSSDILVKEQNTSDVNLWDNEW
jgi:hypothetical protein